MDFSELQKRQRLSELQSCLKMPQHYPSQFSRNGVAAETRLAGSLVSTPTLVSFELNFFRNGIFGFRNGPSAHFQWNLQLKLEGVDI